MTASRPPGPGPAASPRRPRPPDVQRERDITIQALRPVTELLAGVVGSNVEVVLHDLTRPEASVMAIVNGHISGRSVGDPILAGPKHDKGFAAAKQELVTRGQPSHSIIGDYTTMTATGQHLRSTTALFRDSTGEPFAALCINVDLTVVQMTHAWLERMLSGQRELPSSRPQEGVPQVDLLIEEIISDAVNRFGRPVSMMSKDEKIHAVEAMLERGLFMVRGGVERAAAALQVTRFTVYNYLEALRTRNEAAPSPPAVAAARPARKTPRKRTAT
jgi:predicted transcriptional regulator YheO